MKMTCVMRKLKAKLVLPVDQIWVRDYDLPMPPFPGLGIRLAVYDIFNVTSIVVGDFGYDVTCIGVLEGLSLEQHTEKLCRRLGFEPGLYP